MPPSYTLGPGDQVRIITFGEENLTGEFRVNDSGNIALPLVGAVHAAGLTSGELEAAVAAALRRGNLVRTSLGRGGGHRLSADLRAGRGQQARPVSPTSPA